MKQLKSKRRITSIIINEMSFSRKNWFLKTTSLAYPISNHIIKLLVWKDEDNYNKHLNDIESWLFDIQDWTLKPKSKRPTKTQYFEALFIDGYHESLSKNLDRKKEFKDYQNLPLTSLTIEEVQKLYKKIIERSSDLLSKNALDDFEKQVWNKIMKGRK